MEDTEAQARIARLEALLSGLETLEDRVAREQATEVVQALVELYGAGLERIVEQLAERDDGELAGALAGDELVSHLLLLHDLHPVPLDERVAGALAEVRPYLESHGGDVELLGIEEGVVRLRLEGSCKGCPSSAVTLELAIEEAIHKAAPDIEAIETEGAVEPAGAPAPLLQLEVSDSLRRKWTTVEAMPEVASGASALREVAGEEVLFLRLHRSLYAYRSSCPACGHGLEDAPLEGARITCPGCEHRYDIARAGRSPEDDTLQLEPVPLLTEGDGAVKLALGSKATMA